MDSIKPEIIHGLDEVEIKSFVGKNADYYLGKWKSAKEAYKKVGWNWSAFLGGIFWLGYRKLYATVGLLVGMFLVIDIIQIFVNANLDKVLGTTIGVLVGIAGNSLYYKHMNKKIANIKKKYTDDEVQKAEIIKAGGTSWIGVGLVIAIVAVEIIISTVIESFILAKSLYWF